METIRQLQASLDRMLDEASRQVRRVDPASVADRLADYLVIDVREPAEVLEGYLPGAFNVPRGTLEFRVCRDPRFGDRQRPVLTYSGNGDRSALAALTLVQLGYRNVQSLDGGLHRWAMAGLPVE